MALFEGPDLKWIKDKNGNPRIETLKEYDKRIKKETEERYEEEIKIITDAGFTRSQAEYLYHITEQIYSAIGDINAAY